MPIEIEPWTKKTARLSAAARGAYMDLLLAYWRGEELPANDDEALMRLARCTEKEWAAVGSKVLAYFKRDGDLLTQERADEEKAKAKQRYEQKVSAGQAGGQASVKQKRSRPQAGDKQTDEHPPERNSTHLEHLEQSPDGDETPNGVSHAKPKRASRLSETWTPSEKDLAHATERGLDASTIAAIAEQFFDHWRSKPTNNTSLDWSSNWRTWVKNHIGWNGTGPWPADGGRKSVGNASRNNGLAAYLRKKLDKEPVSDGPGVSGPGSTGDDFGSTDAGFGESEGGGGPILDADECERLSQAAGDAAHLDAFEERAGGGPGIVDGDLSLSDPGIPGGRGAVCADEPNVGITLVAGVGGVEGAPGYSHSEAQAADASNDFPDLPQFLRREKTAAA